MFLVKVNLRPTFAIILTKCKEKSHDTNMKIYYFQEIIVLITWCSDWNILSTVLYSQNLKV